MLTHGTPAELKAGADEELRLELVLDPEAGTIERPQFAGPASVMGNRIVVTVPANLAGQAAAWANDLRHTGRIEEFSLAPSTLEDAYVALVGASQSTSITEESNVRAA